MTKLLMFITLFVIRVIKYCYKFVQCVLYESKSFMRKPSILHNFTALIIFSPKSILVANSNHN